MKKKKKIAKKEKSKKKKKKKTELINKNNKDHLAKNYSRMFLDKL